MSYMSDVYTVMCESGAIAQYEALTARAGELRAEVAELNALPVSDDARVTMSRRYERVLIRRELRKVEREASRLFDFYAGKVAREGVAR